MYDLFGLHIQILFLGELAIRSLTKNDQVRKKMKHNSVTILTVLTSIMRIFHTCHTSSNTRWSYIVPKLLTRTCAWYVVSGHFGLHKHSCSVSKNCLDGILLQQLSNDTSNAFTDLHRPPSTKGNSQIIYHLGDLVSFLVNDFFEN